MAAPRCAAWHEAAMSLELAEPRFLLTAGDAAALFEPLFAGCTREKLLVAHVAEDRRLLRLAPEDGGPFHIDLPLRAIIADAARLGSAGLILAHCHPSGDPTPSDADIAATRKLRELAAPLGIALYDHLVFGGGGCRSFRALGLV